MNIDIRQISELNDIKQIADLMQLIWNLSDREVVSTLEMRAVSRFGILLGAFNDSEAIVGFIYALPVNNSRHYSHMMGVDPAYQGKGIGWEMKKRHRILAIDMGVKVIEWTVDPLLPNNSRLNFGKLGCKCNKYFENYYGSTDNNVGIYSGIPTDRFLVEWYLHDKNVISKMDKEFEQKFNLKENLFAEYPLLNKKLINDNLKILNHLDNYSKFTVEVPNDFQKLKHTNIELAKKWRVLFRKISRSLFSNGFTAIDFVIFNKNEKNQSNYFLFEK
ncbi:MAG: hypothetical protein HeimC3_36710 [Candidatus Heimdallarchaeota archaeon LC_3]|nr:MAG: hypothetical protein HeimC3_36710 [Candidatus Heimdallarchaeota archaeon LC_3]